MRHDSHDRSGTGSAKWEERDESRGSRDHLAKLSRAKPMQSFKHPKEVAKLRVPVCRLRVSETIRRRDFDHVTDPRTLSVYERHRISWFA